MGCDPAQTLVTGGYKCSIGNAAPSFLASVEARESAFSVSLNIQLLQRVQINLATGS